jgi:hypothetical protein
MPGRGLSLLLSLSFAALALFYSSTAHAQGQFARPESTNDSAFLLGLRAGGASRYLGNAFHASGSPDITYSTKYTDIEGLTLQYRFPSVSFEVSAARSSQQLSSTQYQAVSASLISKITPIAALRFGFDYASMDGVAAWREPSRTRRAEQSYRLAPLGGSVSVILGALWSIGVRYRYYQLPAMVYVYKKNESTSIRDSAIYDHSVVRDTQFYDIQAYMSVTTLPTLTILLHSYNHPFLTAGIGLGPTFAVFNSVSEANQSFSSNVDCNAEFDLRVGWFFFDHGESPDAPAFFLRLSYSLEAFADLTGSKKGTDNRDSTDVAFSWFNQVLQLESGVIW